MKTCHIYSFLIPVPKEFREDEYTPPIATIPVELKDGRTWQAAVLGNQTTIHAIRVSIPGITEEKIEPDDFRRFGRLRNYLLDCIRLIYDANADFLRVGDNNMAAWNFLDSTKSPKFSIVIKQPLNPDYRINVEGLKILIAAEPKLRPVLHLIADGADTRLPVQFRFLSYYKIIELHYRVTTNKKFRAFLDQFMPEFQATHPDVSTRSDLCRRLSKLRTRCAHIKMTTGDLGFSHLEAQADELLKTMPIIQRMAARCIAVNYPGSALRFSTSPEETASQLVEMEAAGLHPIRVL